MLFSTQKKWLIVLSTFDQLGAKNILAAKYNKLSAAVLQSIFCCVSKLMFGKQTARTDILLPEKCQYNTYFYVKYKELCLFDCTWSILFKTRGS